MISLSDVRNYLLGLNITDNIYLGNMDSEKTEILSLRNRTQAKSNIAIGGYSNISYETMALTIYIHWNKSYTESESKANFIYLHFKENATIEISGKKVFNIDISNPFYIGTDERNIQEFVLDLEIKYNKE